MGMKKKLSNVNNNMDDEKFKTYSNNEYNFSLQYPVDWDVVFENETAMEANAWWQPVRLQGQNDDFITIVTTVVEDSGEGLDGYMERAENDLRGMFPNFAPLKKQKRTLLNWPSAWMTYTYDGNSGKRIELNVTFFFGKGHLSWFQFICEADNRNAKHIIPLFTKIIESLQIGELGIRYPNLKLSGITSCVICNKKFSSKNEPNSVINLKIGKLLAICEKCFFQ